MTAGRELAIALDGDCGTLVKNLRRALVPEPPLSAKESGFIADDYAKRLDARRAEAAEAKGAIENLQSRYVQKTGSKSLKIRANSIMGHYVEVPASSAKNLGADFTLRQGLASTTRFTTPELDRLAATLEAAPRQMALAEQGIFTDPCSAVLASREALTRIAHAAAAVDLDPVAEALLEAEGRTFVANDCRMGDAERLWLLTGSNMAGKSTFLRQVAIIVLMAQVGPQRS
jgi:DNA mismatch repair protein MutS